MILSDLLDIFSEKTGICCIRDKLMYAKYDTELTLDVPGYKQVQSFTCGFTAGLMILHTFYPEKSIDRFYNLVKPHPEWGTSTGKLINALRKSRIGVSHKMDYNFNKIKKSLNDGYPILVTVKTGDSDIEHWVVIYGYGIKPNRVFIAGNGILPYFNRNVYRWQEFRQLWAELGEGLECWGK